MYEQSFQMAQTFTNHALSAQKSMAQWQLEQMKLAEKQVATFFETTRTNVDMTQQMAQDMSDAWFKAMTPPTKA